MTLDDLSALQALDSANMLGHIDGLPEQFAKAWQHAQGLPLADDLAHVERVVICGMGGSAIGGDVLAAFAAEHLALPITVSRGYHLPGWVIDDSTLVIVSSYSGNTEETLSAYEQATQSGAQVIGLTTGGSLADQLKANSQTAWVFPDEIGHPRAAIGWSVALLLALVWRLGWVEGLDESFTAAVDVLKTQRERLKADVPLADNPAKQLATALYNKVPMFVGAGAFEPIARRWKGQFNENANTLAIFETLPEMNHNAVVGIEQPQAVIQNLAAVFLTASEIDHPRVRLRHQLTAQLMQNADITTKTFEPAGESLLEQMLVAIQFGDYLSFYTAMLYDVDPAIIAPIKSLKQALKNQGV